ncbi:MAG: hypothetical protein Salg2KO_14340 [Salibacteraceae bacterium]
MKSFLSTLAGVLVFFFAGAQDYCGQHIIEKELRDASPELDQKFIEYQSEIMANQNASGARAELRIIPVVFHVIHNDGPENISDAQIHDAMRIINEDFSATNPEIDEIVTSFTDDIGISDIEFRLARRDPDGNATTGIEHIKSNETYVGDDGSKLNPWPRDQYLNIWVTDVIYISGAAAYAYRPPAADGNPSGDGVISNHRYVGTIGTSTSDGGKTLTHEIGHYLGLPHTWGETNAPGCDGSNPNPPCDGNDNCTLDDGIFDTPNCLGVSNGGCQLNRTTCGSLDNVQNHMDYASCEAMFTKGQVSVMRNSLNSPVADRDELWKTSNLVATGVVGLREAAFTIENGPGHCLGDTVQFFDASSHGATSWSWKIDGPETFTSDDENPSFVFTKPGIYSVELLVSDDDGDSETILEERALAVSDYFGHGVPFTDDFSSPGDWVTDNHREEDKNDVWEYVDDIGNNGDGCYKMNALGSPPNRWDDLILASIDMRPLTDITIEFDVAYSQISTSDNDKLSLQVSSDCGQSWRNIWSRSGSDLAGSTPLSSTQFEPTTSDWETFSVSNVPTQWFSGNTMFRFRFESDFGNNLYLDNLNIDGDYDQIPKLVYPIDGMQERNERTKINWQAVPDVDSYDFELSESESFNGTGLQSGTLTYIDASSTGTDTEYWAESLEHGTQYFWRVRSAKNGSSSGWSDVWSFTVAENGVGVEMPSTESISIYPNPAKDRLNVVFGEASQINAIAIYSMDGSLIMNQTAPARVVSSLNLNIQNLEAGMYILETNTTKRTAYKQFVVSK